MSEPRRAEYDLGTDRYKRRSRLVLERDAGNMVWSIVSDPVDQRDDGERIASLTSEQLIEAGHIAEMISRRRPA